MPLRHLIILLHLAVTALTFLPPAHAACPPDSAFAFPVVPPDSADSARLARRSWPRATAETAGFNIGLWAFDRYVKKGHYAYISWHTIKENFRHGFNWDDDHLGTNMFAHPYNGALFFNAGRSNGFGFWQSSLFAIGGSAMWELFMESEYPSTNDILATPIGGMALGEVLYRTSDLVLDDRQRGARRAGREIAALLLSPMRGLTRLITGRAWQPRTTTGRRYGTSPLRLTVMAGARMLTHHDHHATRQAGGAFSFRMTYGRPFADSRTPYEQFSLRLDLNAMRGQPLLSRVEIIGQLAAWQWVNTERLNLQAGLYQHFDYFDSDTLTQGTIPRSKPNGVPYKLGTPASAGAGLRLQWRPRKHFRLDAYAHGNVVILGGILSDFYRSYHRNYNWSSGFSMKYGLRLQCGPRITLSLADRYYRLYSWKGYPNEADWSLTHNGRPTNVQGDNSRALFNHLEAGLDCRIAPRLSAGIGFDWYARHTFYRTYMEFPEAGYATSNPLIYSRQMALRAMLTYAF